MPILIAGDQAELGVHLVAVQTVDDIAPRLFEPARPHDVVLLVKARLELHEHQHFLAVFGRLDQRLDHFALLGDAVKRHLDGDDRIIVGRLLEHIEEGLHALIGIGEQLVALRNLREDRLIAGKHRRFLRDAPLEKQLGALAQDILNPEEEGQIQRRVILKHVFARHIHVLAQRVDDVAIQLAGKLQAHRRQALAPLDQLDHELPVVKVVVIERIGIDIGIARDADERLRLDVVPLEHLGNEVQNQLLGEHIRLFTGGYLDQPREYASIARNDAQLALAVLALEHDHRVNVPVAQERKRLAPPHDRRGDERRNLRVKIPLQTLALLPADLPEIHQAHARLFDLLHEAGIHGILAMVELMHARKHGAQLLGRSHVGLVVAQLGGHVHLVDQRTNPHHEKLIQIALVNRGEGQPFAQRHPAALRFLKHALVEFQPGQLTVHEDHLIIHRGVYFLSLQRAHAPCIAQPAYPVHFIRCSSIISHSR